MPYKLSDFTDSSNNALDALLDAVRQDLAQSHDWPDFLLMSDQQTIIMANITYAGGWPAVIRSHDRDDALIWLLMVPRFGLDFCNRIFWRA